MRSLHLTSPLMHGKDVRDLQATLRVKVDGQYGPLTAAAVRRSKYLIGFPRKALDTGATVYYLEILYGKRPKPAAYSRTARIRARQVQHEAAQQSKADKTRAAAVRSMVRLNGTVEHPPESNRGPGFIDDCQLHAGHGRFGAGEKGWPWCGCAVHEAYRLAGVDLPGEIRSVGWLYSAAHAGHPKFKLVSLDKARKGDIVILFGSNTHMGLVRENYHGGDLPTVEGNTSPGNDGSQDNGGGIHERHRDPSAVVAIVRVVV